MADLVFGELPGVPVGTVFPDRKSLHNAGVHKPIEHGISGREDEGAESIVVSKKYEDDEDYGSVIIYTGAGGRDRSKGMQIADQVLARQNKALARNQVLNIPVRVIRKINGGYRYDGLFRVEEVWHDRGKSGFEVVRYRLVSEAALEAAQHAISPEPQTRPGRQTATISRIIRDSEAARGVKAMYSFKCQICQTSLETPGGLYAEAAHIRPLGGKHDGPDNQGNILCLCPNHHVLLDYGAISIKDDMTLLGLNGRVSLDPKHSIDLDNLRYHRDHIFNQ